MQERTKDYPAHWFDFMFGKGATDPIPVSRYIASGETWIGQTYTLRVGTSNGAWEIRFPEGSEVRSLLEGDFVSPMYYLYLNRDLRSEQAEVGEFVPQEDSPPISPKDIERVSGLARLGFSFRTKPPFASTPVRAKPRRTYDPARTTPDPEGDYVPMYLADVFSRDKKAWTTLKKGLEDFGKAAGLFDEISVRQFGKSGSEPFQVQVRRFDGRRKGPHRNLIDVGHGVSQILPVITELLRPDAPPLFLLQQPEVHLHPSAQAALATFFCQVASREHQLIVETHSDHILDRVRMEVRDGRTPLKPEDVSILYFERGDLDVNIHSIRIDQLGNILDAPKGYRRFFMEETTRSLWPDRSPAAN